MTIQYFQPEVWSAQILSILAKKLVYAGAPCVNRNYEGEISAFGDTVHITSVADVNIFDYTKDTDLTAAQALTDAEQLLTINQAKAFNFAIDDIDARQVRSDGALMTEAAQRAAFGLADKADQFVAAKMAVAATNTLGLIDASGTSQGNVYDKLIVPAGVKLDEANVPSEGRFMVVSPSIYGRLLLDTRFIHLNESGLAALINGVVGSAGGFGILKSNNAFQANRTGISTTTASGAKTLTSAAGTWNQGDVGLTVAGTGSGAANSIVSVNADGSVATAAVNSTASALVTDFATSGGGQLAIAGSSIATSYAEQISKVEAYRPQLRFADALKGLHLYGGKVTRGQALVVASVKTA